MTQPSPTPQDLTRADEIVREITVYCLDAPRAGYAIASALAADRERVMKIKQEQVDYWGHRTERAEAEIARLRAENADLRTALTQMASHQTREYDK